MHSTAVTNITEFYGVSTVSEGVKWPELVKRQFCPYLGRKCIKVRKSNPTQTIGTCSVLYGREPRPIVICPYRLLENRQVFTDCMHLLTRHEPGNQLHIIPEVSIPGGSVDYFLASAKDQKVMDFVGLELQTLDTTGTVWPERQRFLRSKRIRVDKEDVASTKGYGMNWKMTAKTVLVQLHHKVQTFEGINMHLVLAIQDLFLNYMASEFQFEHLHAAALGDAMHIHSYKIAEANGGSLRLVFDKRSSTDSQGIAKSLGMQTSPKVDLEEITRMLEAKMTSETLFLGVASSQ